MQILALAGIMMVNVIILSTRKRYQFVSLCLYIHAVMLLLCQDVHTANITT